MISSSVAAFGAGPLFTEPVLVFNQKAKLVEVNAEYAVYNQGGAPIAAVREVGQSLMKKVAGSPPRLRAHNYEVIDLQGQVLLRLSRPAKIIGSKLVVRRGDGTAIGQIVQRTFDVARLNARFSLEARGDRIGIVASEDPRGWECSIQDADDNEVARITRSWAGMAKHLFTKADHYVLQFHRQLEEPLRSLVIASAVAFDVALRQR